jgi:ubiquinone/menaquinone biosynthesis C-methylase UbiE
MVIRAAIDSNVRLSRATSRRLGFVAVDPIGSHFKYEAEKLIRALPDGATVLDLGGGRRCDYADAVRPPGRVRLVAVDISPEELAANTDVTETCIADVAAEIPLPDASADLILSYTLLEHVDGVSSAVRNMARVLRPGGVAMHFVPCRYSVFGTAARLLPFGPLLRLTHAVRPETKGVVEFPIVYDRCWPQALEREFRDAGFTQVETWVTWTQTDYFAAVFPLYMLVAAYEHIVRLLRLRKLGSYTVVRAVR